MTQKAIVSLLWGSQYEALRQFLATHEPMAVLVSARATSPQMRSVIESTGSTVVHLEDLLDAEGVRRFETETIQLQTQFAQYLDTLAVEERAIGRESGLISSAVAGYFRCFPWLWIRAPKSARNLVCATFVQASCAMPTYACI